MQYIRFFNQLRIEDVGSVGGKNASFGEMYNNLTLKGIISLNPDSLYKIINRLKDKFFIKQLV